MSDQGDYMIRVILFEQIVQSSVGMCKMKCIFICLSNVGTTLLKVEKLYFHHITYCFLLNFARGTINYKSTVFSWFKYDIPG